VRQPTFTCPSLGLMDDPDTSLAFPSIWNNCYRSRPLAAPKLKHQEEFCLCQNYRQCPLFLSEKTAPLPEHLKSPRVRKGSPKRGSRNVLFFTPVLAGILFVLVWAGVKFYLPKNDVMATVIASTSLPVESFQSTSLPSATSTPTLEVSTSTLPAPSPTLEADTPTTIPQPRHQLEVPIGTDRKFIIHSVLVGENLDQYERKYNTSIDAIMAINYELKPPLWVGMLVVIPIGFVEVSELPAFETYMVEEDHMAVEQIAEKFKIDVLDLKSYNLIVDGEQLKAGDWLLIPHQRTTP